MVVVDGMGGYYYGEIVVQIVIQILVDVFQCEVYLFLEDFFCFLQKGMINVYYVIFDYMSCYCFKDMFCMICVVCIVQDNIVYWVYVGDFCFYLMWVGWIIVQMCDYLWVCMLVDEGMIIEVQVAVYFDWNKIYSCLGSLSLLEIEFLCKMLLEYGDILLLCIDGLWGVIFGDVMVVVLKGVNLLYVLFLLFLQIEVKVGLYGDNFFVVVVCWEESYVDEVSSLILMQIMIQDEVMMWFEEFGCNLVYKSDLIDDEIEKVIDEICFVIDKFIFKK